MKKKILLSTIFIFIFLTGCGKANEAVLSENIKKMELTGNLVTHKAYFHNVIEYEKKKGTGLSHVLEIDRKLFAEYTGTIKLGIDLSKVKIKVVGNQINVTIPQAIIIGEPNVSEDDFKAENFIESRDSINKNKITGDDSAAAFDEAQKKMKEEAQSNTMLLSVAQKRAKAIIEENIKQFSNMADNKYTINWEYE